MLSDAELLRCYADAKSDAAFAELVNRRINLVYSVAFRQCGGDAHLAQDAVQRVFADLARKAGPLSRRPTLTGWLYRSARFAASDLIRAENRRRAREQKAHAMHELHDEPARDADWEQFRPILDEAISELHETDRDAVMLRFFEQQPFREIGAKLRLSEDAARMRVDRALDKLRVLLADRGVASTTAALAMGLANQAGISAPAGLASSIAGGALAASGGAVTASGGVKSMVAWGTILAVVTVGTAIYQTRAPRQPETRATRAADPTTSAATRANTAGAAVGRMVPPPDPALETAPAPLLSNQPAARAMPAPPPVPAPTFPAVAAPSRTPFVFPGGTATELEHHMDEINAAFRRLQRQIDNPARNGDSLLQVQVIRENAQAALELEPKKKSSLPEAEQPKFIADYRGAMRAFLLEVQKLEAAVQAGDHPSAQAALERLTSHRDTGHRQFRKEKQR